MKTLDISVIVPFKDKSRMTIDCIVSLQKFGPKVKEIILISNNSTGVELETVRTFANSHDNVKVLEYNKPFNYQTVNNWGANQSSGSVLYFLNNDTELVKESVGLVEKMYDLATKNDVGIVGCLLLYGDKKHIQHAGVYLVSGGLADHMYVGKTYSEVMRTGGKTDETPYDVKNDLPMTAVTAASILVERKKFDIINGFNEDFLLCGGDVDLCIRMNHAGYQTYFTSNNGGFILHKESQSRKFSPVLYNDFYHSYLSYSTAFDPKVGDKFLPKICKINEVK